MIIKPFRIDMDLLADSEPGAMSYGKQMWRRQSAGAAASQCEYDRNLMKRP